VHTLVRFLRLADANTVKQLATAFDDLQPATGSVSCPASQSEVVAYFQYERAPDVPVTAQLGGCASVTNGEITRTSVYPPGPTLLKQLIGLLAAPPPVCHQSLWNGAFTPRLQPVEKPGEFSAVGWTGYPIILRFAKGCARGVEIDIRPPGIVRVSKRSRGRDHRIVAIALLAQKPGKAVVTSRSPSGKRTHVRITVR
jgi:hypothetical protein